MNENLLLMTDVYKLGHMRFYPEGTTKIYSYLCARSTKKEKKALFFGLQYYLKLLSKHLTVNGVYQFFECYEEVLGEVPQEIKSKIWSLYALGHIPLRIKAVPEGTIVDNKNVLMTVTNTHPDFAWVVGFFESLILKVWNPISVATCSYKYKQLVTQYAQLTSDNLDIVPYLVHDFGYRGCSSEETAAISGAAHLVNFLGTDTLPAIKWLKDHYIIEKGIGGSVPASEHSVMCCFGKEGELDAFHRMLDLNPTGIVSIVSDTYDFFNVMTNFVYELKDKILAREGKTVFRPDSGDPKSIICGDPKAEKGSPEYLGAIRLLDKAFGSTINSKGYKVLNPKVGLIYGDGMYFERFESILKTLCSMGYDTTNLVVGIGGLLLQQHNRDDLGFAFKATYAEIGGKPVEIFKDPKTDPGKKSHRGLMRLVKKGNTYVTEDQIDWGQEATGELNIVFNDGKLINPQSLNRIRDRIHESN